MERAIARAFEGLIDRSSEWAVERTADPTGCGDAHRAGLLYGLTNEMDWETITITHHPSGESRKQEHIHSQNYLDGETFKQKHIHNRNHPGGESSK